MSLMPGNKKTSRKPKNREVEFARFIDRAARARDMPTLENIAEHVKNKRSAEQARAALQWLRGEGGSYTPFPENSVWIVR